MSATDARKWTDTQVGLSLVITTRPPSTACTTIAPGWAAASQPRSPVPPAPRGRRSPGGHDDDHCDHEDRDRHQPVAELDPAVDQRVAGGAAATRLCVVQCGQSGQPRPDWLNRTAAPVKMMSTDVITPASAHRRSATGVGASTRPAARRPSLASRRGPPRECPGRREGLTRSRGARAREPRLLRSVGVQPAGAATVSGAGQRAAEPEGATPSGRSARPGRSRPPPRRTARAGPRRGSRRRGPAPTAARRRARRRQQLAAAGRRPGT